MGTNHEIRLTLIVLDLDYQTPFCDQYSGNENCSTHKWTDQVRHNLKAIMKVMRFASRRGKNRFNVSSIIGNNSESLKYPVAAEYRDLSFFQEKRFDDYVDPKFQIDVNSMIPWCRKREGSTLDFKKQLRC